MLRVPPLSGATAQAVPPSVSPDNLKTPELAPEPGPPPLEEDSDMYMSEVPYVPSPRQETTDQFWGAYDQNERLRSEPSPNGATLHPQNVKAPGSPSAGGKRKASTHTSEQMSSVGINSDGTASDVSIQLAGVSKKARKTPKEPVEDEDMDESLDKLFTGRKKGKKLSKKKRTGDSSDDDEDSYKNSMSIVNIYNTKTLTACSLRSLCPWHGRKCTTCRVEIHRSLP